MGLRYPIWSSYLGDVEECVPTHMLGVMGCPRGIRVACCSDEGGWHAI